MIVGPVGSTKTTAGIVKIAYHAAKMAPCKDGVRRSRAVWVRNTREQLRDTSIPDFLRWFPDGQAGIFAKTEYKFTMRFSDVECEVLFRGLDDSNDVRRLLSLQASFFIFDEFREINPDIFNTAQGRLGRYPSKLDNTVGCCTDTGESNAHLWGMSNPPDMDTFWEQYLSDPPDNASVFFQPSGLSPEADWLHCLPDNYYENLAEGKSEDWVDVYIHAQFGKSLAGKPVFRSFNVDTHVAQKTLRHIDMEAYPLLIGMDFGLNPSAVVGQLDARGRLLIFESLTSDGMGTLRFIREKLKPVLATRFPQAKHLVIGDPAGRQRAQTDEKTVYDILKQENMFAKPAATNSIVARIASVEQFLNRTIDGEPALLIDPCCGHLIKALRGGYRYKIKTNGEVEDSPEKNESSHIADAAQYLCLHADGGAMMGRNHQTQRREVKTEKYLWV